MSRRAHSCLTQATASPSIAAEFGQAVASMPVRVATRLGTV